MNSIRSGRQWQQNSGELNFQNGKTDPDESKQVTKSGWPIIATGVGAVLIIGTVLLLVPNSLGHAFTREIKSRGYLAYTPEEAIDLAYSRCSTCHSEEKMLKYCTRCGPPFIVVAHFMKKYVDITNTRNSHIDLPQFSDAEISAIVQTWNALIGNWEDDWPKEDLRKLLDNDQALIDLLDLPLDQRPIETALKDKHAPGSYQRYDVGVVEN